MDSKIFEYKKILDLNVYALSKKDQDIKGGLTRRSTGYLPQQYPSCKTHRF